VRRCEFLNIGTAISGVSSCAYVLLQDNAAPLETGLHANFVWGHGNDWVVLGNKVANSTREHCMRFAGMDRVMIARNDLTNLDRRAVDPKDYNKKTIVLQDGTFAYVAGNKLTDGPLDVSTATTVNSTADLAKRGALSKLDTGVFECNTLLNTHVNIEPNAKHLMFRNNVVSSDARVFDIAGKEERFPDRFPVDVTIVNNTGITTKQGGCFILAGDGASGVVVVNNLYVRNVGFTQPVSVQGGGAGQGLFAKVANNVWPAESKKSPVAGENEILEDVKLDDGYVYLPKCKAATAGKPFAGVFTDLFDNPRTGEQWSVGATISRSAVQIEPVKSVLSP
jgi:hypothetical protein